MYIGRALKILALAVSVFAAGRNIPDQPLNIFIYFVQS